MTAVRKMVAITDEQIIAAMVAKAEPRLRRRFLQIMAWLRARHDTAAIAELVAAGRAAQALSQVDIDAAIAAFSASVNAVYLEAGRELAAHLAEQTGELAHFDQALTRVVRQLQDTALRVGNELALEQQAVVRSVLIDGARRGLGPREVARDLVDSIGLTEAQEQAVQNYRALLEAGSREALRRELRDRRFDASVRRAADEPLSTEQIDRMVERYRARMLNLRAETIARTEGIGAVHRGTEEMWQQTLDRGLVAADELEGTWLATHDPRTRESHVAMDGQTQPFGTPFVSGDGYLLRYPHDPSAPLSETVNCRCARVIRYRAATTEQLAAA